MNMNKTRLVFGVVNIVCAVLLINMCLPLNAEEYKLREAAQYIQDRGGSNVPNVATSEHFALKWGNENIEKLGITAEYASNALAYFEHIRDVYKDQVGLPLIKSEKDKYKINIYITGTGLKPFLEGHAFGFPDTEGYGIFIASARVMRPGSSAAAHELGHATQGETVNFRDSDYVGWFWECHAQFMAQQVNPTSRLPMRLDLYCDMSRFDWSTAVNWHQYTGWLFLQYLKEKEGFGYPFINSLWLTRAAYQDEDPVSKMIRLKGMSKKDWADLFGDFAKRNVIFGSYEYGKQYKASLDRVAARSERRLARWMAALEPVKGRPGWYAMPYAGAPHQNGYNVIPLYPEDEKVTVTFKGLVNTARQSDWRATVVIVNETGEERFSDTVSAGDMTMTLEPDEKEVYLVVAAVPHVYKHITFLEDYRTQERFPYEVKITGAKPKGAGPARLPGKAKQKGAPHQNGGGFVAETASVADSAYVGPDARVLDKAVIADSARIEDYAVVCGDATVSNNAIVSGHAYVTDKAVIAGNARIRDYARIYDDARIDGNARVFEYARVQGDAHMYGNAIARGACTVSDCDVEGTACFTGASNPGRALRRGKDEESTEVTHGIFTGYVSREDCDKAENFGGLLARYAFDQPNNLLLKDSHATGNGIINGKPEWIETPERVVGLEFNGKDEYIELPRYVSDLRNCEISLWVNWQGDSDDERIFDFGCDADNCVYLTPKNESGKAAFVMVRDGEKQSVEAETALTPGEWYKLIVKVQDGTATLTVNDTAITTNTVSIYPEDVRADANYLARGQEGDYFKGLLSDMRVGQ
jgi:carbonic anhydrase/acetyltransferase-like protein (isoleucine patch superfamily)